MTDIKNKSGKSKPIGYWVATGLLAFGMLSGGLGQVFRAKWNVDGMIHLGYPLYFMTILGAWKILGVITLLMLCFTLLKEWAYAGFFFAMTGAVISHLISGDGVKEIIAPLIFAVLTVVSCALRPVNRKILINSKN